MFLNNMRDFGLEEYLKIKNRTLDKKVLANIENNLKNAQQNNDENLSNYFWFLRQVFLVQQGFLLAFKLLKEEQYEESWNKFDNTDIALGFLENNIPSNMDIKSFNLDFIGRMIKEYQQLFPYQFFISRECVIKKEKCSICGQTIRLRHNCGHVPGKVYMGKLCLREVLDAEYKACALVTDPFDKYALLHIEDKEYNYGMLKYLLEVISDPYDDFHVDVVKRIKDEYKKAGRNKPCPCGSGEKYKKCHFGTSDERYNHYIVNTKKKTNNKKYGTLFFNTWVNNEDC